jgi:hypothetical protein
LPSGSHTTIFASIDKNKPFNLDVLDALKMLKRVWDCVAALTIKNCFSKAGFSKSDDSAPFSVLRYGIEEEEPEEEELQQAWKEVQMHDNFDVELQDYINIQHGPRPADSWKFNAQRNC